MSKVQLVNVQDNPYRDRNLFPTDPTKMAALKASIDKTGFWDNLLVRFRNNELADGTVITSPEELSKAIRKKGFSMADQQFELAYGHHRVDVLRDLEVVEMDVPVKWISDENMLHIMAEENKEGWGGSIKAQLETVRQVKGTLEKLFADYASFSDYEDEVGKDGVKFSKKQFQDAKSQGIGYRTVQAFLGSSWSASDVRIPMAVFKAIDKGYFSQTDVFQFESMGILDSFTSLVSALYEGGKLKQKVEVDKLDKEGNPVKDAEGNVQRVKENKFVTTPAPAWPLYTKAQMVHSLIAQCTPSEVKDERGDEDDEFRAEAAVTQNQLNRRRVNMLKKCSAPTNDGSAEYRLKAEIIKEFFPGYDSSCPPEERENLHKQLTGKDMKNFKETEGIGDWPALEKLVDELTETFDKLLTADPGEPTPNELQQEMDPEQGKSEDYESEYKDLDILLDEEGPDGETAKARPIGSICRDVVDLMNVVNTGVGGLMDRVSEINLDEDVLFSDSVIQSITTISELYASASSPAHLKILFKEILADLK